MHDTGQPSAVLVDTSRSPYARLKPVPLTAVTLADDFWAPRRRTNREVTLPAQYRLLEETGRLDNFRRAAGQKDVPFQGRYYNDSDVYKWLEAAAWTLAADADPLLAGMVERVIAAIEAAQGADGYLNTYFTGERVAERWTNLRDMHELYCAGHLIQAAVAHHRATGSARPLNVARRLADHVCAVFGPAEAGKRPGAPGHPEIEMALVELARLTGELAYREQAGFFLDMRGRGLIGGSAYHQDHAPWRELEGMAGHAVRALYLNCGATDLYAEAGEPALRDVLERLWLDVTAHKTYVSGGLGARYLGEAFGAAFELPNARAYAETCAAIGSVMWNWRMLTLAGEARYADALETALYNGFLAGLSLDGERYFYQNPLADDGAHRRQAWFDCACCPTNVVRLLATLPGYGYSISEEGIWVHLYAEGTARLPLPGLGSVGLVQQAPYPWGGAVEIGVEGEGAFSLFLRIPAWCEEGATLAVNGQPFNGALTPGSYAQVRRAWRRGDVLALELPMPARRVACHPYVAENAGRAALMRGPLLYCLEQADNPGFDLRDVVLPATVELQASFCPDLLGGVVALRGQAEIVPPDAGWEGRLYRTVSLEPKDSQGRQVEVIAIPYYAWANREPGQMRVWLRSGREGQD